MDELEALDNQSQNTITDEEAAKIAEQRQQLTEYRHCLLYTSPSPRD